jgi:hypothetical protein
MALHTQDLIPGPQNNSSLPPSVSPSHQHSPNWYSNHQISPASLHHLPTPLRRRFLHQPLTDDLVVNVAILHHDPLTAATEGSVIAMPSWPMIEYQAET